MTLSQEEILPMGDGKAIVFRKRNSILRAGLGAIGAKEAFPQVQTGRGTIANDGASWTNLHASLASFGTSRRRNTGPSHIPFRHGRRRSIRKSHSPVTLTKPFPQYVVHVFDPSPLEHSSLDLPFAALNRQPSRRNFQLLETTFKTHTLLPQWAQRTRWPQCTQNFTKHYSNNKQPPQ